MLSRSLRSDDDDDDDHTDSSLCYRGLYDKTAALCRRFDHPEVVLAFLGAAARSLFAMSSKDFKTEFAVSMHCDACVNDIKNVLKCVARSTAPSGAALTLLVDRQQEGIESYDIDLAEKRVVVQGRGTPSSPAPTMLSV